MLRASLSAIPAALLLNIALSLRARADDPLPSWNDLAGKRRIVAFVNGVTKAGSLTYVAPEDRIATFDNDGALSVEKPMYRHLLAVFQPIKAQMAVDSLLRLWSMVLIIFPQKSWS